MAEQTAIVTNAAYNAAGYFEATPVFEATTVSAIMFIGYYRDASTDYGSWSFDPGGSNTPIGLILGQNSQDAANGSIWHSSLALIDVIPATGAQTVRYTTPPTSSGGGFGAVMIIIPHDAAIEEIGAAQAFRVPDAFGVAGTVPSPAAVAMQYLYGFAAGDDNSTPNFTEADQTSIPGNANGGVAVVAGRHNTPDANETMDFNNLQLGFAYAAAFSDAGGAVIDFPHPLGAVTVQGQLHQMEFPTQLSIPVTNLGAPVAGETNLQYFFWLRSVIDANAGGVLPAPALQGNAGVTDGSGNFLIDTTGVFDYNDVVVGFCREPDGNLYAIDEFLVA